MAFRVVKVGGSLLDLPELPSRWQSWAKRQQPAANVLIGGGGALVDALRALDRAHGADPVDMHWWCVQAMEITARFLSRLLAMPLVDTLGGVVGLEEFGSTVFAAKAFLRGEEPHCPGPPLEQGWHVSSDSIAARLAAVLPARELVLLKSAMPPPGGMEDAAGAGYVDAFFPKAARALPVVRCVNLRDPDFAERSWAKGG